MSVRTAAFFDLDKTIIATSSSAAFSRPFFDDGLITRADAIRAAYAQFLFQIGGADERQTNRLRDALSDLIKGWEVARVEQIVAETLHELIDPVVYSEAVELIERHHSNGRDVVIVSASASQLVNPIAQQLGADHVIASELTIEDGIFTGEFSFYAFGPAKAEAIKKLAAERGYDLANSYAYSDSITDADMLNIVGHGFAVNPDRTMRRAAADHGWGALNFRQPVALRSGKISKPVLFTAAGLLAAGVTAGLVWNATRNRTDGDKSA